MSVKVLNQDRPLHEGLTCPTDDPSNVAAQRLDVRGLRGGLIKIGTGITGISFYTAFNTSDTPGVLNDENGSPRTISSVSAGEYYPLPINETYCAAYLFIKVTSGSAGTCDVYLT